MKNYKFREFGSLFMPPQQLFGAKFVVTLTFPMKEEEEITVQAENYHEAKQKAFRKFLDKYVGKKQVKSVNYFDRSIGLYYEEDDEFSTIKLVGESNLKYKESEIRFEILIICGEDLDDDEKEEAYSQMIEGLSTQYGARRVERIGENEFISEMEDITLRYIMKFA